jgi:cytochrome o ubiquinol oxidase operon protein cyoD
MNEGQIDSTGAAKGSFKSYATGFILAFVLSLVAFALVMNGALSHSGLLWAIYSAAVVQILVHLHYFLHLDKSSAARWNVLALLFTVLIMMIFIGGTLWIMYNLNYRMM